jgi:hypothetical protein
MLLKYGPSRIFSSRVPGMNDNFDLLDLEKSIFKAAEREVVHGRQLGPGGPSAPGVENCPMAEISSAAQITQL